MSRSGGKYFTAHKLKERGWTNSLIERLLPPPKRMYLNHQLMHVWERSMVKQAETDERFIKGKKHAEPKPEPSKSEAVSNNSPERRTDKKRDPKDGAGKASDLLKSLWGKACKDNSLNIAVAEKYHRAIVGAAAAAGEFRVLRQSQAVGYIDQFLALEKKCEQASLPVHTAHFVRALSWVGNHLPAPTIKKLKQQYVSTVCAIASASVKAFESANPGAPLEDMINDSDFPVKNLISMTLDTVYSVWYVPRAIRTSLSVLVALNPKDEYPEARAMRRHFVLHIGGTNTGKTYAGFQRLKTARSGVYLAPLRLLALEGQETLLAEGVDCSLTTGEEEDCREGDTHVSATAEKLDMKQLYDVAVIDECQMIADPQRGYAWTRAILGVLAPEVHLCAAPEAKDILIRLIESCGDTYEVEVHKRKAPLVCMNHTIDYTRVQPGDALITFSKVGVLSVAEDLRQSGKEPAIIYGALPYSTRRKQMQGFLAGEMKYVVSTDAIGMGLNLPIRRIIFMETEKFDGTERRELRPEEIQQIAGRAGRYGMYNKGYVGATQNLGAIRAGLGTTVPPIGHAVVGFSDLVLQVDFDLLEVLTEWNRMPTAENYVKLDISRYIELITKMREMGFTLSKEDELKAANIPFDEDDEILRELFFRYLRHYVSETEIEQPGMPEENEVTLPELELYCRKLDLYYSFAKAFGYVIDEDRLYDCREDAAEQINEILLHRLKNNIRFCPKCGRAMPLHHHYRICDDCFRKANKSAPGYIRDSRGRR